VDRAGWESSKLESVPAALPVSAPMLVPVPRLPRPVQPGRCGGRANISRYGPSTSRSIRSYTSAGLRECSSHRGSMTSWRTDAERRFRLPRRNAKHISGFLRVQCPPPKCQTCLRAPHFLHGLRGLLGLVSLAQVKAMVEYSKPQPIPSANACGRCESGVQRKSRQSLAAKLATGSARTNRGSSTPSSPTLRRRRRSATNGYRSGA
jgi:hypothetical protein